MKKIILILVCIAIMFTLFGCGASMDKYSAAGAVESPAAEAAPMEEEAIYEEEVVYEDAKAEEAGIADVGLTKVEDTSRKLVYTCDFQINTSEFEKDYNNIIISIEKSGGYIENEYTEGTPPTTTNDYGRYSSITARIPVENYNMFTSVVSGIGTVTSKNQYTEDISDRYYDTESRIELLNEQKDIYMDLLKDAENMEDIIVLQEKISECIYEIEELEGSKKGMDKRVDYATVNINLNETVAAHNIEGVEKSLGKRAGEALELGLAAVGEFFEGFAIVMAAIFPALIVAAIVIVAILFIIKGVKKLKNKIKAKKNGEK